MPTNNEIVVATLLTQAAAAGGLYGLLPLLGRPQYNKSIGDSVGDDGKVTAQALQSVSVGAFLATFALKGDAHSKKLALFVGSATAAVWAVAHAAEAMKGAFKKPKNQGIVAAVLAAAGFFVALKKTGPF